MFRPLAVLALGLLACNDPPASSGAPAASSAPTPTPSVAEPVAPTASAAPSAAPASKPVIVCDEKQPPVFHQPGLEADVRKKLEKKPDDPISWKDLASPKIKSINLSTSRTDFLDPCIWPKLLYVKDVFLGEGDLDDLSLLSEHAQLVSLRASINKVKDLTPLSKLTKLDRLDLGRTLVRDVEPLATLVNLTELQLDGTDIDTIQPLASLKKLQRLSIRNTRVADVSPLAGLADLKSLDITGSAVSSYPALSGQIGRGLRILR